jgi:hypothetical protein
MVRARAPGETVTPSRTTDAIAANSELAERMVVVTSVPPAIGYIAAGNLRSDYWPNPFRLRRIIVRVAPTVKYLRRIFRYFV